MTKSDLFWSMIVLICLAIIIGVVAGYNIPKNSQSPDSPTLAGSDLKVMKEIEMSKQPHRKPAPEGLVEKLIPCNPLYQMWVHYEYAWYFWYAELNLSEVICHKDETLQGTYDKAVIIYNNKIAKDENGDCYWEAEYERETE